MLKVHNWHQSPTSESWRCVPPNPPDADALLRCYGCRALVTAEELEREGCPEGALIQSWADLIVSKRTRLSTPQVDVPEHKTVGAAVLASTHGGRLASPDDCLHVLIVSVNEREAVCVVCRSPRPPIKAGVYCAAPEYLLEQRQAEIRDSRPPIVQLHERLVRALDDSKARRLVADPDYRTHTGMDAARGPCSSTTSPCGQPDVFCPQCKANNCPRDLRVCWRCGFDFNPPPSQG